MRIIKQRLLEMLPDVCVFLDVASAASPTLELAQPIMEKSSCASNRVLCPVLCASIDRWTTSRRARVLSTSMSPSARWFFAAPGIFPVNCEALNHGSVLQQIADRTGANVPLNRSQLHP
jgi:hypothetical protein